jgi:hypothetical protein
VDCTRSRVIFVMHVFARGFCAKWLG